MSVVTKSSCDDDVLGVVASSLSMSESFSVLVGQIVMCALVRHKGPD